MTTSNLLSDVIVAMKLIKTAMSDKCIQMVVNKELRNTITPWEEDNSFPPNFVRRNLQGKVIAEIKTHCPELINCPVAKSIYDIESIKLMVGITSPAGIMFREARINRGPLDIKRLKGEIDVFLAEELMFDLI
jgi:hypothetical protein